MINNPMMILICCLALFACSKSQASESILDELHQEIETALKVFNIPGASVGVLLDGKIVLSKGYGYRDLDLQLPVTEDTLFGIGSCTKAFTAFLLGQLVDEKIIDWDDPIVKYLPELCLWNAYSTQSTTVRDLLTHRTGFSGHDFLAFNISLNRKDLTERLQYFEPIDGFRTSYHYSNIMYALAGHLVERVTGSTWEMMVQEKIFKPLMMDNSCFYQSESENSSLDYFYYTDNDSIALCPPHKITFTAPAAGIKSSAKDMLKWVKLHLSEGLVLNKQLIQNTTLKEMHAPQLSSFLFTLPPINLSDYGLGWRIGTYQDFPLVMHGGTSDGFQSQLLLLPSKQIGIIVLTNCTLILQDRLDTQKYFISAISNVILDQLLHHSKSDWISKFFQIYEQNKLSIPKREAEKEVSIYSPDDYVGVYEHPGYGMIEIHYLENHLRVIYGDIFSPLLCLGDDCFKGMEFVFSGKNFRFLRDSKGKVYKLYASLEPMVKLIEFSKSTAPIRLQKGAGL